MKNCINLFAACALILFLSSCSQELRPFTANILREGNWSDTELHKIQFYFKPYLLKWGLKWNSNNQSKQRGF